MLAEPGRWSGKPVRIRRGPATVTGEATAWRRTSPVTEPSRRPGKARRGRPGSQETFLRPPSRSPSWKGVAHSMKLSPRPAWLPDSSALAARTGARRAGDRRPAHRRRDAHALRRPGDDRCSPVPVQPAARTQCDNGTGAVTRGAVIAAAGGPVQRRLERRFGNPTFKTVDGENVDYDAATRRISPSSSTARAPTWRLHRPGQTGDQILFAYAAFDEQLLKLTGPATAKPGEPCHADGHRRHRRSGRGRDGRRRGPAAPTARSTRRPAQRRAATTTSRRSTTRRSAPTASASA